MTGLDKLPAFMAHVVRYERPAFDPGQLLPEMGVVVTKPDWNGGGQEWRAKVISKARVLVKVQEIGRTKPGQPRVWTMRLDTQKEQGGEGNYVARFRTIGQYEYDQTEAAAQQFLRDQGINVNLSGLWYGREIELARLIWPGRKGEQA